MINMNILAVVTPPSIYHGFCTHKTFWKEKFTGEEKFTLGELTDANMNNRGCLYVRKHRDIKGSEKYVTLDISLKFDSMDNMRITSSESKENLGILGKGLITFMDIKAKVRPKK